MVCDEVALGYTRATPVKRSHLHVGRWIAGAGGLAQKIHCGRAILRSKLLVSLNDKWVFLAERLRLRSFFLDGSRWNPLCLRGLGYWSVGFRLSRFIGVFLGPTLIAVGYRMISEWAAEWAGAASTTVDHADMRESTPLRKAVVITRPRFESRRFLSLGTRVSDESLPPNDNEGSPITAPPSAHSPIHSPAEGLRKIGCLFAARYRPGQRCGVNGEPARPQ